MPTSRIGVFDEQQTAKNFVKYLEKKGYKIELKSTSDRVVVDTRDFGGALHYIDDPDDECFIIVGKRNE